MIPTPEGYTHVRTAQKAARAIHYKVQCPNAFAAGANGPDSFFCFEVWKPAAKRRCNLPALGNRMHTERTGAFLQALLRHVRTQAQIEYALGFLCHYALDTAVHPYVVYVSGPGQPYGQKGGHGYFEIALDSTLHAEDTGVSEVPAEDASPLLSGTELAEVSALLHTCLLEVYGLDISVELLADAFYDTYRIRRIFTSRYGVRRAFYWLIEPIFAERGFITGHVSPARLKPDLPEEWTDPTTGEPRQGGAFALLKEGQRRCELMMTAALGHWLGKVDDEVLTKTLGSMDYVTGTQTERSAMPPQNQSSALRQGTEAPDAPPAEPAQQTAETTA